MPKLRIHDLGGFEASPVSPASLRHKVNEVLLSSVTARAQLELVDADSGEYRIVLQGTLDRDEPHLDDAS